MKLVELFFIYGHTFSVHSNVEIRPLFRAFPIPPSSPSTAPLSSPRFDKNSIVIDIATLFFRFHISKTIGKVLDGIVLWFDDKFSRRINEPPASVDLNSCHSFNKIRSIFINRLYCHFA